MKKTNMAKYVLTILLIFISSALAFPFSREEVTSMDSIAFKLQGHDYIWYENRSGPMPVAIILTKDDETCEAYISNGRDGLVTKCEVECSAIVKWLFSDFVPEYQKTRYSDTTEWTFMTYSFGYVNCCGDEHAIVSTNMIFKSEEFEKKIDEVYCFFLGLFLHDIIEKNLDELPIKDWRG